MLINAFFLKHILNIRDDANREIDYISSVNEKGFLFTDNDVFCHKSQCINLDSDSDDFDNLEIGSKLSYNCLTSY